MAANKRPTGNVEYNKLILGCVQSYALPLLREFGHFRLIRSYHETENDEEFKKAHPASSYVYITIDPMNVRTERTFMPGSVTQHEIPVVPLSAHSDFQIAMAELTNQTKLTPIIRAATLAVAKVIQGQFHDFLCNTPYSVGIIPGTESVGGSILEKYVKAIKLYDAPGRSPYEERAIFCSSDTKWRVERAFLGKRRFVEDNRYYCFPQPPRKSGKWNAGIGLASDATLRGIVRYALRVRCGSGREYESNTARTRPANGEYNLILDATADAFKDCIAYLLSLRKHLIWEKMKGLVEPAMKEVVEPAKNLLLALRKTDPASSPPSAPSDADAEFKKKHAQVTGKLSGVIDQINLAINEARGLDPASSFQDIRRVAASFLQKEPAIKDLADTLEGLFGEIPGLSEVIPDVSGVIKKGSEFSRVILKHFSSSLLTAGPTAKDRLDAANAICQKLGGQSLFLSGKYGYEEEYNLRIKKFNTENPSKIFDENALGDVEMYASLAQEREIEKNKDVSTAENDFFAFMYAVAWRLNGDVGTEDDFKQKIKELLVENNGVGEEPAAALAQSAAGSVTAADYPRMDAAPVLDYDPIMMVTKWDPPKLDAYNNPLAPYGTTQPINVRLEGLNIADGQIEPGDIFEFRDLWHADSDGRITTGDEYPETMTFKVISAFPKGAALMARSYELSIAPYPVPAGLNQSSDRMPRRFMRIKTDSKSKAKSQPNAERCVFAAPESLGLITLPSWKGEGQSESDPVWESRFMEVNNLRFELQEEYDAGRDEMKYKLILRLGLALLEPRSIVSFDVPRQ